MNLANLNVEELESKVLKDIDGGYYGLIISLVVWASGEYHSMKAGSQRALEEWIERE